MQARAALLLLQTMALSLTPWIAHGAGAKSAAEQPTALRQAVDAMGGERLLRGLRSLVIESAGERRDLDQNFSPNDRDPVADGFKSVAYYDLANDRMRLEVTRMREGIDKPQQATYLLGAALGAVTGQAARFGAAQSQALTSDRWAAVRREQEFLNPVLLLRRALESGEIHEAPDAIVDGKAHHVLILDDRGAPVQLFVDPRSGYVDRLEARVTDHLRRDVV